MKILTDLKRRYRKLTKIAKEVLNIEIDLFLKYFEMFFKKIEGFVDIGEKNIVTYKNAVFMHLWLNEFFNEKNGNTDYAG